VIKIKSFNFKLYINSVQVMIITQYDNFVKYVLKLSTSTCLGPTSRPALYYILARSCLQRWYKRTIILITQNFKTQRNVTGFASNKIT